MKPTLEQALDPFWWIDRGRVALLSPTRSFPARRVGELTLDIPERTLSGVPFGCELRGHEPFGRADWYSRYTSLIDLAYYDLGMQLSVSDGAFNGFTVT